VLGAPKAWERAALKLDAIDQVMRFEHVRYEGIDPMGYELVCLPQQRFPNLASNPTLPDDLEELAQNSGVLVARAKGKVRAVPAPSAAVKALSLTDGQPVDSLLQSQERILQAGDPGEVFDLRGSLHLESTSARPAEGSRLVLRGLPAGLDERAGNG
jgi:DNA-binding GntR family transcriptional regulator